MFLYKKYRIFFVIINKKLHVQQSQCNGCILFRMKFRTVSVPACQRSKVKQYLTKNQKGSRITHTFH